MPKKGRLWDRWSINTNNDQNITTVTKYKKLKIYFQLFLYSGTELNRHGPYGPQDFKSCVSTSSTTRVSNHLLLQEYWL